MLGAHDQNQLVFKNWKRLEVAITRFRRHQREVDIALDHFAWQPARDVSKYLDLNFRMPLAIFQNELRQKIEGRALVRTHRSEAALQTLHLGNRLSYLISQSQNE